MINTNTNTNIILRELAKSVVDYVIINKYLDVIKCTSILKLWGIWKKYLGRLINLYLVGG